MDDSPFVSPAIKEYIAFHKIEETLNEMINDTLRKKPDDPYSMMSSIVTSKCAETLTINNIKLRKVLFGEFKVFLALETELSYKGSRRKTFSYVIPLNTKFFETTYSTSVETIIEKYKNEFAHIVNGYNIDNFPSFDKALRGIYDNLIRADESNKQIAILLSNSISFTVYFSQAIFKETAFNKFVFSNLQNILPQEAKVPNLGFTIFKCGKNMNSKVKFERFMFIINNSSKISREELMNLVAKLYASVKKVLTSGKAGEAGMKMNAEGSYFTPNDNSINDTVKVLEDILKDLNEGSKVTIGIDCNANNFYTDAAKKYEMDGFKTPIENDQLVDFYVKYLSEHPLITYLEDPMSEMDLPGWKKLISKFEGKANLTIAGKNLFMDNLHNLKDVIEIKELLEVNENLPEEEKNKILDKNKQLDEENSRKITPQGLSFRVNEFVNISEIFECVATAVDKIGKHVAFSVWDNHLDTDNTFAVDIGLGMRANNIILNSLNLKSERMIKINRYVELVEEYY